MKKTVTIDKMPPINNGKPLLLKLSLSEITAKREGRSKKGEMSVERLPHQDLKVDTFATFWNIFLLLISLKVGVSNNILNYDIVGWLFLMVYLNTKVYPLFEEDDAGTLKIIPFTGFFFIAIRTVAFFVQVVSSGDVKKSVAIGFGVRETLLFLITLAELQFFALNTGRKIPGSWVSSLLRIIR